MFGRSYSIDVDGSPWIAAPSPIVHNDGEHWGRYRQLEMEFRIETFSGGLSLAEISVYNLSDYALKFIKKGRAIRFKVGSGGSEPQDIFSGVVGSVFHERIGPNIMTRLLCGPDTSQKRRTMSGQYGKNASIVEIVRGIGEWLVLAVDMIDDDFKDVPLFVSGYAFSKDPYEVLNDLAVMGDFDWFIENGRIVVIKRNVATNNETYVAEINPYTGLIGSPELSGATVGGTNATIYVNLIAPDVPIGRNLKLESRWVTVTDGTFFNIEQPEDYTPPIDADGVWCVIGKQYSGKLSGNTWQVRYELFRGNGNAQGVLKGGGSLLWGDRSPVDERFRVKVRSIAANLKIDPNWLMVVMAFETKRTFSPSIKSKNSSATGLIQFTESTARGLGTSTRQLSRMTAVEQLDWVEKYLKPYAPRIRNLGDCYMAVFAPVAIGKPDSAVLYTSPSQEYNANKWLDWDLKGYITRGDCLRQVNEFAREGENWRSL